MEFKRITEKRASAGIGPARAAPNTLVSLLSDSGVPIEHIADRLGHSQHTEPPSPVYQKPVPAGSRNAAVALGPLFESRGKTDGAIAGTV